MCVNKRYLVEKKDYIRSEENVSKRESHTKCTIRKKKTIFEEKPTYYLSIDGISKNRKVGQQWCSNL